MKKLSKIIIPTALFALSHGALLADNGCNPCPPPCPPKPCPPPCTPCCPPPDPCANCAQLWPTRGPDWIVTPNAGPCVADGIDMFVTAEFIYWTARTDYLNFAFTTGDNFADPFAYPKGKIYQPNWKFEPGFKVGVGFMSDCDGWDLYANYTWLRFNNVKKSVSASDDPNLILYGNIFFNLGMGVDPVIFAQAKWKLHFNVVDLELGRNFFISNCLHLRPHFGLKGTWQKQSFKYFAEEEFIVAGLGQEPDALNFSNQKLSYWGVGIRAGLDTAWHFTKCFSMVGEVAATALWEGFEPSRRDLQINIESQEEFGFYNTKNNFHTIKPVLELYLGLRWESWFCCDSYHLSIEAGWEEQWWGQQGQFIQPIFMATQGDLTLQGLTVKFRFDF